MRAVSRSILNESFNRNDKTLFKTFSNIIENSKEDINAHRVIWKYDQKIGGYGGYAAPLNPTINPFNHLGNYRNVFRSLQYARCDMFFCTRPRTIILDASLHVECLVKLVLSKYKIFSFIHNRREFGKNIEQLYKDRIIDEAMFYRLDNVREIMNLAKHDTDPKQEITFEYMDAIIFYFEIRKIGLELLQMLNRPSCNKSYAINEEY